MRYCMSRMELRCQHNLLGCHHKTLKKNEVKVVWPIHPWLCELSRGKEAWPPPLTCRPVWLLHKAFYTGLWEWVLFSANWARQHLIWTIISEVLEEGDQRNLKLLIWKRQITSLHQKLQYKREQEISTLASAKQLTASYVTPNLFADAKAKRKTV